MSVQAIVTNPARRAVVDEARTWLGTRYMHLQRTKGRYTDCVGLLIGVGRELGLGDYIKRDYEKIPDPEHMRRELHAHLVPIEPASVRPADILWFAFRGTPRHVAIVADYCLGGLSIIHAYGEVGKVVEHRYDEKWRRRVCGAFLFPGAEA